MPDKSNEKEDLVTVFPDVTLRLSDFKDSMFPEQNYAASKELLEIYYQNPELAKERGWTIQWPK